MHEEKKQFENSRYLQIYLHRLSKRHLNTYYYAYAMFLSISTMVSVKLLKQATVIINELWRVFIFLKSATKSIIRVLTEVPIKLTRA